MELRVNIGNSLQNEVPVVPAVAFDVQYRPLVGQCYNELQRCRRGCTTWMLHLMGKLWAVKIRIGSC